MGGDMQRPSAQSLQMQRESPKVQISFTPPDIEQTLLCAGCVEGQPVVMAHALCELFQVSSMHCHTSRQSGRVDVP
jgi:hypothetical protein